MTDGNTIRSVAKAMELLQLLSDAGEAMTLTAISERAGLPKSTVFGLLTTMRDYDVITQHADGKYALGLRLFEYGCRASAFWNISSLARPYLEHLAEATGASAMLSTYENGHIVALDQAEGRDSLRIVSAPGARLPLAEAAVLLATAPKSNSAHNAIIAAMADIQNGAVGEIPRHLKNVHADSAGSARPDAYKYPHNYPNHYVKQRYLPEVMGDKTYYEYGPNKTEQAAKRYWDDIKGT